MEVEEIQAQPHNGTNTSGTNNNNSSNKFSRICNGRISAGIDPADISVVSAAAIDGGGGGGNRLRGWHHSSRIIRVSRASGGKDRHSKVWTSKGLRDRRVRLSVTTAIQFYDLQDRLGYDQPSKAVEWLINAAADSISELPSLNSSAFPDTPKQLSDEKSHNQQHLSVSKSACSSTSETSKGSAGGLSLSRTTEVRVNRVKARERARERASKDKERERETPTSATANDHHHHHHNSNINSVATQNSSFTELLTSGITHVNSSTSPVHDHQSFFNKGGGGGSGGGVGSPVTVAQMDYFSSGLLNLSSSTSSGRPHSQHHHVSQIHMGGSIPMSLPPPFGIGLISGSDSSADHFSFVPEQHLIPIAAATSQPIGAGDYSLNFSIGGGAGAGGGFAGFNRGTLQSNTSQQSSIYSHHHHHHHQQQHVQRFSNSPMDASSAAANIPFFFGAAAVEGAAHQFPAGFDGRLQLCYGDASRVSDQKGKGKN